ncbi:S-layer homology domain-containing protein [Lyngbya aestuarii]|uniref:S-layer homology domain-containing protein n=1 Tax=Lyngbya aestuarii TaxID=118322 RepID=UPI00403E3479
MFNFYRLQSGTAAFLALGITTTAIAPLVAPAPSFAQTTNFTDVSSNYWAKDFIEELSDKGIIAGFPDGSFRPNASVTRAQYAAMLRKANQYFQKSVERGGTNFVDVPSSYWASSAIQEAYRSGFLAGYPGNVFRPEQNIPREQVLVSLANGLDYSTGNSTPTVLNYYNDASNISSWARAPIAAATVNSVVVNYPTPSLLNPTRNATRAEVAAFIYQALVKAGQAPNIASQYIVNQTPVALTIPAGVSIPVKYGDSERILLTKDETVPLTLTVDANLTTSQGKVVIPAGSQIEGELRSTEQGARFVAKTLLLNGRRIPINGSSKLITTTETVRKGGSVVTLLKNAALGTAAAAAISAVTGDRAIATEELLIGAGSGAALSLIQRFLGRNSVELISIEPDTDLDVTLSSDLVIDPK